MPLFSDFTPFGLLEFSSDPSEAEKIYGALRSGYRDPNTGHPSLDLSEGTYQEAKLYAWAMGMGDARMALRQVDAERLPETSYYNLKAHERRYKIVPEPDASVPDRRRALAARRKAARGARYEAVVDALETILGDAFIAFRPIRVSEAVATPADPSGGPGLFKRHEVPAKSIRIVGAAARITVPMIVAYENSNPREAAIHLLKGDELAVDPGHWDLAERVTVEEAFVEGDQRFFQTTFTRPHDANTYATTGNIPLWANTKRHVLIVATSAAARSPQTRARIHDQMQRMMRAPTTWEIVEPNVDGVTVGPFKLGQSPLGSVPVEAMNITV